MSDVEWVEETDWSKVKKGDRVKLVRGDDEHRFRVMSVEKYYSDLVRLLSEEGGHWSSYSDQGSTLFVERPVVELPTEPGYYLNKFVDVLHITRLGRRSWLGSQVSLDDDYLRQYAPFRRLRPVDEVRAETAKEVVKLVKKNIKSTKSTNIFRGVAEKFGVTDE